jgi:hypothetical protein
MIDASTSTACTMTNCYIGSMNCSAAVFTYANTPHATITKCTFFGCAGASGYGIIDLNYGDTTTSSVVISDCIFSGSESRYLCIGIRVWGNYTLSYGGSYLHVYNCKFSFFDYSAVYSYHTCSNASASTYDVVVSNCIASNCSRSGNSGDFYFVVDVRHLLYCC